MGKKNKLLKEIILKKLNAILDKWREIIELEDNFERDMEMNCYFEEMPFYEIQGLLDLYNKSEQELKQEKEKNKALETEYLIQRDLINADFLKDYIHKDKIKKLLETYDKNIAWANADDHYYFVKFINEILDE